MANHVTTFRSLAPSFAPGVVALLVLLSACAGTDLREPASPYDEAFDAVMARYDLPGLALGVIENGRVVYRRTAGELVAGSGDPVTPDTLFKIASLSKAMTASVLARQVDAGKLRWDDAVIRHLPQFRMYEPWVTANMQVQDLLVHNSGLPEGGGDLMLWPEPNHFTRADILAGLAYLKPAYSFRSGYAYDNLLYVVAGEVAAAVGGAPYEELVRREVFEPLGLACRVGEWRRDAAGDVAQPHMRRGGRNVAVRVDAAVVPAITSAAAGGIRCSLDDMLAWMQNWLEPDPAQTAWLSEAQRRAMWTPHTPMPISERRRDWDDTHDYAYAFGFRLADVDGAWTVSHTGTLMGMYSAMTLLPDQGNGFVLLTNGEAGDARIVLNEVLLKHFTAPGDARTADRYAEQLAIESTAPQRGRAPETSSRRPAAPEARSLRTGIWRDPWFGEVSICAASRTVRFSAAKSPLLTGTVIQAGERFLVDWDDPTVDVEAWLDFPPLAVDSSSPGLLTMAKVDPEGDFSFDYEDLGLTWERACE
jgi:CubicO group peptidase (beta-lactamase class C family)